MKNLSGHLMARLADKNEHYASSLIDAINQSVRPPRPVAAEEVYIRAMYIVSDEVNSQGGCFAPEELERLAQLLVDAPVMVGHKRDSLPVARNFKVEQISEEGRQWLKSYFYWMKDSKGAEDLKNNIDGGIYKECSISFIFGLPECSVCGDDIRRCRHVPFQEYTKEDGMREIAHFYYRNIERVLETSLVFRGAIPNTRITDALNAEVADTSLEPSDDNADFVKEADNAAVDANSQGWARARLIFANEPGKIALPVGEETFGLPHQPGLAMRITRVEDNINIESGMLLPEHVAEHIRGLVSKLPENSFIVDCLLYGTRGKERVNGCALAGIIDNPQKLHRLRLRLSDLLEIGGESTTRFSYTERVRMLHDQFASHVDGPIEIISNRMLGNKSLGIMAYRNLKTLHYNHGFEIIASDDTGSLQRLVLTPDTRRAAVVSAIDGEDRSHRFCRIKPIGDFSDEIAIRIPCSVSLDCGDLVVVSGDSAKGDIIFRDILPGYGPDAIGRLDAALLAESAIIHRGRDALVIELVRDVRKFRIIIHHFSPKLFSMGRRFVADIDCDIKSRLNRENAVTAMVGSFTENSGLVRMEIKDCDNLFGASGAMILRPALIDGEKRYLCFRDKINSCQEVPSAVG